MGHAHVRPDNSKFIEKAFEASKKFGASSPEARLAWETVEEMDSSSSNSKAMSLGSSLEECEVEQEVSQECKEYGEKLDELNDLISQAGPSLGLAKNAAKDLKAIKMKNVAMPVGEPSPLIKKALINAKAASKKYGAESSEAKLAWEELEEISSANEISGALGGTLEDECLTEMIEACEALEEVQRVLNLPKTID